MDLIGHRYSTAEKSIVQECPASEYITSHQFRRYTPTYIFRRCSCRWEIHTNDIPAPFIHIYWVITMHPARIVSPSPVWLCTDTPNPRFCATNSANNCIHRLRVGAHTGGKYPSKKIYIARTHTRAHARTHRTHRQRRRLHRERCPSHVIVIAR